MKIKHGHKNVALHKVTGVM